MSEGEKKYQRLWASTVASKVTGKGVGIEVEEVVEMGDQREIDQG
jgi:hypothetical protein